MTGGGARGLTAIVACALVALAIGAAGAQDDSSDFFGDSPSPTPAPGSSSDDFFGDAPAVTTFQQSGDMGGEFWQKFAADTVKDYADEYRYSSLSLLLAEGTYTFSPSVSARLSAMVTYDYRWNAEEREGDFNAEVWEAYASLKTGSVDWTAGQKIWAWGLTDVISPTDLINPFDLNRFLDSEMSHSKLPVPSIGATWYFEPFQLTGVYLPFFRGARFDIAGTGGALFGRTFPTDEFLRFVEDDRGFHSLKRFLDNWDPDWNEELTAYLSDPDWWDQRIVEPGDDLSNGSGAVRLGGRAGGYDFDVMGYYLWDQIPTIYVNPQLRDLMRISSDAPGNYAAIPDPRDLSTTLLTDPLTARYHRIMGPGADFGTTIGPVSVRTEGVALFGRRTYRRDLSVVEKPVYNWAANLEYTLPGDVMLSGTFYQSQIGDYDSDLVMEPVTSLMFLGWRKTFFQEKLKTEGVAAYDFTRLDDGDWRKGDVFGESAQLSPFVEWAWTDTLRTSLGANLLYGPRFSYFGLLREKSRVFASMKIDF